MTSDIRRIVEETLSLPEEQRQDHLTSVCNDDTDLLKMVTKQIEIEKLSSKFANLDLVLGDQIGPYRLIDHLGEGGMGRVFLAEQREPVKRKVALKVVRLGMDTREVLSRFEAERQALTLMHHPNVAGALDAGSTDKGRPYFIMEFVRGVPITEYCDDHKIGLKRRLRLFLQACEGLQHAHQKSIIHRDLKPSNVIVGENDSRPLLKIIDFGIAKSTQQQLSGDTLHTQFGSFIGTPNYSSPEQAQSDQIDIDTRSDVYSLGVLLYELLLGELPFDTGTFNNKNFSDIQKIIREVEPPTPEKKLEGLKHKRLEFKSQRGLDYDDLKRNLKSDLGWIIQRSMEKDRNDRYPSASALAADLRRYLDRMPVEARPHAPTYRARKFIQRHRLAVAASVAAILLSLAGLVVTSVLYLRAVDAEADARVNEQTANELNAFLLGIFENADPEVTGGRDVNARELIGIAERQLNESDDIDPFHELQMLGVIGNVYRTIGDYEASARILDSALQKADLMTQPRIDAEKITLYNTYAELAIARNDFDAAIDYALRAEALAEQASGAQSFGRILAMSVRAQSLDLKGQLDEALNVGQEANALALVSSEIDQSQLAGTHNVLGHIYQRRREFSLAEEQYRMVLDLQNEDLDELDPKVLVALNNLAVVLVRTDRLKDAEAMHRQSLDRRRRIYGSVHISVAVSLNNLARVLSKSGRYDEAAEHYQESIQIRQEVFGESHSQVAAPLFNLGMIRSKQGRYEEALADMQAAHELNLPNYGYLHARTARVMLEQARTHLLADQAAPSEARAREALEVLKQLRSPIAKWVGEGNELLTYAVFLQGRYSEVISRVELPTQEDVPGSLLAVLGASMIEQSKLEQLRELITTQTARNQDEAALPWLENLEAGLALAENRTEDAKKYLESSYPAIAEAQIEGDEEIAMIKMLSERRWAALNDNSGT